MSLPDDTILLTIPQGYLRWRSQPFKLDPLPNDQDVLDEKDEITAGIEEWQRESQRNIEYAAAQWPMRMRHLGLLPPRSQSRIPWLKMCNCECDRCRPAPMPRGWSPINTLRKGNT